MQSKTDEYRATVSVIDRETISGRKHNSGESQISISVSANGLHKTKPGTSAPG